MYIFYQQHITEDTIVLSEDESRHCVRVLRIKEGEEVFLADGRGLKVKAIVEQANPKRCLLRMLSKEVMPKMHSYNLHLLIAPTKNFDRMEWMIEKLVEVGIDRITFIETSNSERTKVNMDRCLKIAVSAMKQSKQWWLPQIDELISFDEGLKRTVVDSKKIIAWCLTPQEENIAKHLLHAKNITLCIGPEGDFTAHEKELAQQHGFLPVSLGESILRTETAALFACVSVKCIQMTHK